MKIAYLFTTFPVHSETFLQREIRAMRHLPVRITIYSLWGGNSEFEGLPVHRFPKWQLLTLLWKLPLWFFRKPTSLLALLAFLTHRRCPSALNAAETLIGIAFALTHADHFLREKPDLYHAVWATVPATAALLLRDLTSIPYSMGAHAYDVFRDGGDWLLPQKIRTARLIHTTTQATRHELLRLGAPAEKIVMIRRGLSIFPAFHPINEHGGPLRLLSVGRFVHKKGYLEQLAIYKALKDAQIPFEARIVGDGRLRRHLIKERQRLGLEQHVLLLGRLEFAAVAEQYRWADLFIFTGKIADNGDRDGLPNVIAEAMAAGPVVLTTPISGAPEAIAHEHSGLVIPLDDTQAWVANIQRLASDKPLRQRLRTQARAWVEAEFDARKNADTLSEKLRNSAHAHPLIRNPWLHQLWRP